VVVVGGEASASQSEVKGARGRGVADRTPRITDPSVAGN